MGYFYADSNNQPVGPVSFDELVRLREAGILSGASFVIEEDRSEWVALETLFKSMRTQAISRPTSTTASPYPQPKAGSTGCIQGAAGQKQEIVNQWGCAQWGCALIALFVLLSIMGIFAPSTPSNNPASYAELSPYGKGLVDGRGYHEEIRKLAGERDTSSIEMIMAVMCPQELTGEAREQWIKGFKKGYGPPLF